MKSIYTSNHVEKGEKTVPHPARKSSRKIYSALALGLFLAAPLSAEAKAPAQQPATAPPAQEVAASQTASKYPAAYLNFGARFGEEDLEGYSDMILPLLNNEQNIIFFNPRVSLMDEGANEFNLGLGYRRMVTDGLVLGGNIFVDSRESAHGNRFNQWGAGVELLSNSIDFRANYYNADNGKEKIGQYSTQSQETASQTTSSTRASSNTTATVRPGTGSGGYSDPYAEGHAIYYDQYGGTITDYTTKTNYTTTYRTTTTTSKWFEQYEAGMDGWDTELGFKLPLPIGPEVRLFGGYYSYDNPFGDDVDGLKARLEIKTGPYLALDAEVFEDETLNGSDFFVGARLQIPLSRDLSWSKFVDGLVSMDHRSLDERMRSEMVQRDVRVQSSESDWQENLAKREVDVQSSASTRTSKHSKTTVKTVQTGTPGQTTKITLADKITFVDKDNAADTSQDGTNEHPYGDERGGIQKAVDNADENTTIFVYEAGGQVNGINRDSSDVGGVYDEQVVMKPGQTITSEITFSGHPTQTSYATVNRPLIKPSTITYDKQVDKGLAMVDYAAAVTMPENTSLRRMAVETSQNSASAVWVQPQLGSGTVLVDNSELHTSGSGSDAFISYLDQENLENLTITGSNISTAGVEASGVLLREMYNADLGSLDMLGSNISTTGHSADGIATHIESSHLGSLNLTGSTISTTGDYAHGLDTVLYGGADYGAVIGGPAVLGSLNVSGSTISTAGNPAYGMRTLTQRSSLGSLTVKDTRVTTVADAAHGIDTQLLNSDMGRLTVDNAVIDIAGNSVGGVRTIVTNSNLDSLIVSNSRINATAMMDAGGLSVTLGALTSTDQASLGSLSLDGNTIVTVGESSTAIGLSFSSPGKSTLGSQLIQGNNITTQGNLADGIFIWGSSYVLPTPAFDADALTDNNNITTNHSLAKEVRIIP